MKKLMLFCLVWLFNCTLVIDNCSSQWVQVPCGSNINITIVETSGTKIYAGAQSGQCYLSSNNGNNWTSVTNNGSSFGYIYDFLFLDTINFFIAGGGNLFKTTNSGQNWTQIGQSYLTSPVYSLGAKGTYLYAGTYNQAVYRSSSGGTTWENFRVGMYSYACVFGFVVKGTYLFAGTDGNGIYYSDNDLYWLTANNGLPNQYFGAFAVLDPNIFVGLQSGGVFMSTNNGTNWNAVNNGLTNLQIKSFTVSGANIFIGTGGGGVFLSTNNGTNWIPKNQGFPSSPASFSMTTANGYIFAAMGAQNLWRRSLSEITDVIGVSSQVPLKFSIFQNYPNPFNPTTSIKFDIAANNFVTLKIYDVLGREISTLVNEFLKAGTYQADWDGSNYSSGVYFYKLTAGDFSQTRKMLLVK